MSEDKATHSYFSGSTREPIQQRSFVSDYLFASITKYSPIATRPKTARYNRIGAQFFQFPGLGHDVWYQMFKQLKADIEDFDRKYPVRFFEQFPELNLVGTLNIDDCTEALVSVVNDYFYDMMEVIGNAVVAYKWIQIDGTNTASRLTGGDLKFSKMNSKLKPMKRFPVIPGLVSFMANSLPILAKQSDHFGTTAILPMLLGFGECYTDLPRPYSSRSVAEGSRTDTRIRTLTEATVESWGALYDDAGTPTYPTAGTVNTWWDYNWSNGYIADYLSRRLFNSIERFTTKWSSTIGQNENPVRNVLMEKGFLTDSERVEGVSISEASNVADIYDLDDYVKQVFDFGSRLSPVIKPMWTKETLSSSLINPDAVYDGENPVYRHVVTDPSGSAYSLTGGFQRPLSYWLTQSTHDTYAPYAYLQAEDSSTDYITPMNERSELQTDVASTSIHLEGFDSVIGRLDYDAGTPSDLLASGEHARLAGYFHAVRNLQGFGQDNILFPVSDLADMIRSDENIIAYAEDISEGRFRPMFETIPMKNPMDPLQYGFYMVLTTEDYSDAPDVHSWSYWYGKNVRDTNLDVDGAPLDTTGTNAWAINHDKIKDGLLWVGDAIDFPITAHFMRGDIARWSPFYNVPAFELDLAVASKCLQDKSVAGRFPTKPYTAIPDSEMYTGSEYGSILGVGDSGYSPIFLPTRPLVDGTVTVSNPFTKFLADIYNGGSQPANILDALKALLTSTTAGSFSVSGVANNDLTRMTDARITCYGNWLPLFAGSIRRLSGQSVTNALRYLEDRVKPVGKGYPSLGNDLSKVQITAKTASLEKALESILDLRIIERAKKRKERSDDNRSKPSFRKPRRSSRKRPYKKKEYNFRPDDVQDTKEFTRSNKGSVDDRIDTKTKESKSDEMIDK